MQTLLLKVIMALTGASAIRLVLQMWQLLNLSLVCFFGTGLYSLVCQVFLLNIIR